MNDFPRQKLKELIAAQGPSISNDPARCRALLLDTCSYYPFEVNVLIAALEENIVPELLQSLKSIPYETLLARLAQRLQNRGIAEDAARWAVNSWALALGIIQVAYGEGVSNPAGPAYYNEAEAAKNLQVPPPPIGPGNMPNRANPSDPAYPNPPTPAPYSSGFNAPPSSPNYPPAPAYPPSGANYLPAQANYSPSGPTYPSVGPGYSSSGPTYPPVGPNYPPSGPGYPPPVGPMYPPTPARRPRGGIGRVLLIVGIIVLVLIVSCVGVFAYVNSRGGLAVTPTPTATATPSPTPIPFPGLATAYQGTLRNTTANLNGNMSITAIAQNKGDLNGNVNFGLPLVGSGPFTGTVTTAGAVNFVVTSNDGMNVRITFTGSIAGDGSISGAYTVSNNQGGTWTASPNSSPIVYPVLYAHYTGTFTNTSTGTTGNIGLNPKSADQQNIGGDFLLGGGSIPFTGTVSINNGVAFSISNAGTTITFTGSINMDGTLNGTYIANAGGSGNWKLTPATA